MGIRAFVIGLIGLIGFAPGAWAGETEVVDVAIAELGADAYRFDVTLRHADEGWKHYADRWDVFDLAGNKLGERILVHPHVDEQPFTRSATITVPAGTRQVTVRGHDQVHGDGAGKIVEMPE